MNFDPQALFTIHPDGTGLRKVADRAFVLYAGSASISPDGSRVAYVLVTNNTYKGEILSSIAVAPTEAGKARIVWTGEGPTGVVWSTDGTSLLSDAGSRSSRSLVLIDPATEVAADAPSQSEGPSSSLEGCCGRWSPDGGWILAFGSGSLDVLRPDGSDRATVVRQVGGPGGGWAAWQP